MEEVIVDDGRPPCIQAARLVGGGDPAQHVGAGSLNAFVTPPSSAGGARHRRVEQLLLPEVRDAAASGVLLEHFRQLADVLGTRPVALPLRCQRQPGHHVCAGRDHALDGDLVRFDRRAARGVGDDRDVPAFAQRLDNRHGDADLGPQAGDDELPAAGRLDRVHDLPVFPGVDERPVAIVTKAISLTPIFFLGFSEASIAVFSTIYLGHTLLVHSNVRIPFGPLKWLIASPQFHRWRHANQREAYDKNFAGQLPFLDMLFGTYNPTGDKVPDKYGVDDPIPSTYFGQIGYPPLRRRKLPNRAGAEHRSLTAGPTVRYPPRSAFGP